MTRINVTVDGVGYSDDVEPRTLLVQYLREQLGKTGTVVGCDTSNCGACTVHLDGRSVKSCTCSRSRPTATRSPPSRGCHERRAAPDAAGVPREPRPAVRLLHAGHDHAGDRPAQRQPEPQPRRRSATGSRATCAAAPATRTSSRPCSRPPSGAPGRQPARRGPPEVSRMTATEDRPRPRSAAAPPQGGPAPDHRPHQWTDNIQLPGMLHLAMVRSPFAHATITAIDTAAAKDVAGRRRRPHRCATSQDSQGSAAERVADHRRTRRRPPTRRSPSTGSPSPARSSPSSWPASRGRGARRRRAGRRRLRRAAGRARPQGGRRRTTVLAHPDLGTNKSAFWMFDSAEAGHRRRRRRRPSRRRATDGIVIEREYRQQRLIPAFMEPRSTVVDPTGEQLDDLVVDPGPALPAVLHRARRLGIPEPKIRVIAPDVGGGFGGKLQFTPEEVITRRRRPAYRQARASTPRPARESLMSAPPRPRPVAEAHPGRHARTARSPASRSTCSPTWAPTSAWSRRRRADPRRVHVQRDLQVPGLPVQLHQRLHQQDVDRRLPRRRPARGDVRHRADDGRARRRGRRRPAGDPRAELDQARGVPVHHGRAG